MDALWESTLRSAWAQCWQVTALVVAVLLVVRLAARNRPHLACVLWLVVLLKCLTPPIWSSPSGVFCWLQTPAVTNETVDTSTTRLNLLATSASEPTSDEAAVVVQMQARPASMDELQPRGIQPADAWNWSDYLLPGLALLWLAGCTLAALVAAVRWRRCWRQLASSQEPITDELAHLLAELRLRLGVKRRTRLLVTSSLVGPAVIGLWRPTIVLPAVLAAHKSVGELEPLLAHELMHIRRGDLWLALLQTIVQCLWWFHPLVHWANRCLTRDAERSCDEEVIAHLGCSPASYARSLLNVLDLKQQLRPVPAFPGVRPVDVTGQRLERIMKLGQGCHRRTPWWCYLAMLLLAAATLPGGALVVAAKEKPAKQARESLRVSKDAQRAAKGKVVERSYDVDDLIESASSELGGGEQEARTAVLDAVRMAAGGSWQLAERIGIDFNGDQLGIDIEPDQLRNTTDYILLDDAGQCSANWSDDALLVRQTAEGHRKIERQFTVLREGGFGQVMIEVRLVTAPAEARKHLKAKWKPIDSSSGVEDAELAFDAAYGDTEKVRGRVETVVERRIPAMEAVVGDASVKAMLNFAQGDARTNILCAPKVVVFNGQLARVESHTQRPFVVGLKQTSVDAVEPQIRVVTEGWKVHLRPELKRKGKVKLELGLALSEIRKVEVVELPIAAGGEDTHSVQVPEVASTRLQTEVDMKLGQSLVIGGLKSLGDDPQPMWVLVTVRKLEAQKQVQANPLPARAKADPPKAADLVTPPAPVAHAAWAAPPPILPAPPKEWEPIVTKVYAVADLLLPLPPGQGDAVVDLGGERDRAKLPSPKADPQSLIDLVTSTIQPASWDGHGGEGRIAHLPEKLSLVVANRESVHREIADLFGQLRRLQDVQVALGFEQIELSQADLEALTPGRDALAALADGTSHSAALPPEIAKAVRAARSFKSRGINLKATVFNGQAIKVRPAAASDETTSLWPQLLLQPVVSADFRALRLMVATQSDLSDDSAEPKFERFDFARGESLALDLSEDHWSPSEKGVPILSKVPYTERLFRNAAAAKPTTRHLLLVTPVVLVSPEVEAVRR